MAYSDKTYRDRELLPFNQIKNEILALCTHGKTGDLCLFTEEKHTAVISIKEGDIVGLRYRISRGMDALSQIKLIERAKFRFDKNDFNTNQKDTTAIPPTEEILQALEIELDSVAFHEIGKKVLVVEDSATQRKAICNMLTKSGYRVREAGDGYEALALLTHECPDLILLDIIMPGIDGYKVMSMIKEKEGMKHVPIIMLTSRDALIDKMRGKVSGTDEYLTKPFKSEELIAKINKYLRTNTNNSLLNARA